MRGGTVGGDVGACWDVSAGHLGRTARRRRPATIRMAALQLCCGAAFDTMRNRGTTHAASNSAAAVCRQAGRQAGTCSMVAAAGPVQLQYLPSNALPPPQPTCGRVGPPQHHCAVHGCRQQAGRLRGAAAVRARHARVPGHRVHPVLMADQERLQRGHVAVLARVDGRLGGVARQRGRQAGRAAGAAAAVGLLLRLLLLRHRPDAHCPVLRRAGQQQLAVWAGGRGEGGVGARQDGSA